MNETYKACNGVIKGGSNNCPQKLDCKRYAVHQSNPNLPLLTVPYQAVIDDICSFKK